MTKKIEIIAEFNNDLTGFVLTLPNSKTASTQFEVEENVLSGDYGNFYLHRYTDWDSEDLADDENDAIDAWVAENKWRHGHLVKLEDGIIIPA